MTQSSSFQCCTRCCLPEGAGTHACGRRLYRVPFGYVAVVTWCWSDQSTSALLYLFYVCTYTHAPLVCPYPPDIASPPPPSLRNAVCICNQILGWWLLLFFLFFFGWCTNSMRLGHFHLILSRVEAFCWPCVHSYWWGDVVIVAKWLSQCHLGVRCIIVVSKVKSLIWFDELCGASCNAPGQVVMATWHVGVYQLVVNGTSCFD